MNAQVAFTSLSTGKKQLTIKECLMTEEEIDKTLVEAETKSCKNFQKKFKGARCSQYCSVWNHEDRDCEIMGSYHLSPSRCRLFLMQELGKEETK